jgi:hypothetical protein
LPDHDNPGRPNLSDTDQDVELFNQAVETPTLEKFENPQLPPEPKPTDKPDKPDKPDVPEQIPSGRLREESENRRRAEREAADLRAQLAALQVQLPQQQPQQKPADLFENPRAFFEQMMMPYMERMQAREQMRTEAYSADNAVRMYGEPQVTAARAALEQGMARHDPQAWNTYNRAMSSHDPYGVITRAHLDRATLQEIGGDLESYKTKILEEAMKNPEFQKRVMQAARGHAQANGSFANSVTQSTVPTIPSLSDIGAVGADEALSEPSDQALFRAAVSAKRRR